MVGYERFREALLDGRIELGASLTQSELTGILGMSLSPMRETMTLLQEDGLITVRKRAGIRVFMPDLNFFRANFQMRTLIEREAVRRFARSATFEQLDAQIAAHEKCVSDIEIAGDPKAFKDRIASLEGDFHYWVAGVFENPVIAEVHRKAYSNMRLFRLAHPAPKAAMSSGLREHIEVLRRCRQRDASGAHDALDKHFRGVMNRVFGSE